MQRLSHNTALVTALACAFAVTSAAVAHASRPTVAEVLAGVPNFPVEDVLNGKTVLQQARESDSREMAVRLACLIPPGQKASLERFHHGRAIMPEKYSDTSGVIELEDIEGSLEALRLDNAREARRYLEAKPGYDLSLSAEEIAAFNALRPTAGQELQAVEAEFRKMLARRVREYNAKGLAGIAPFDRDSAETSSVAEDLRNSTLASEGIQRAAPDIHAALFRFPIHPPGGSEDYYFWTRIQILGRPVFLLNHRVAADFGERSVVIERQFYATQFVGGAQTITALVPVQEGTLAIYTNKTFVDRWSGPRFGTGAKRAIGLKLINDVLREMAARKELCAGTP